MDLVGQLTIIATERYGVQVDSEGVRTIALDTGYVLARFTAPNLGATINMAVRSCQMAERIAASLTEG